MGEEFALIILSTIKKYQTNLDFLKILNNIVGYGFIHGFRILKRTKLSMEEFVPTTYIINLD